MVKRLFLRVLWTFGLLLFSGGFFIGAGMVLVGTRILSVPGTRMMEDHNNIMAIVGGLGIMLVGATGVWCTIAAIRFYRRRARDAAEKEKKHQG